MCSCADEDGLSDDVSGTKRPRALLKTFQHEHGGVLRFWAKSCVLSMRSKSKQQDVSERMKVLR